MKQDLAPDAMVRRHGGDLAAARALFPDAPEPWIDLSTGINPVPYPVGGVSAAAWERLPDGAALLSLKRSAARFYGVSDPEMIAAAPGTQAIIQALPDLFPDSRVTIFGASYGGHAQGWRGRCRSFAPRGSVEALTDGDIGIVVNPNNPDGRLVAVSALRDQARAMASEKGALIVDEAFMEVMPPQASLAPRAADCGAVVLRSSGKIFGLAGLRLGFAVTTPAHAAAITARLGDWAVSGPAIEIGCRAFADSAWLITARERLSRDAARLDETLAHAGFVDLRGTPLFRFARHVRAGRWFTHLGSRGILVRPFGDQPDRLRFGLPGDEAGWARLAKALAEGQA